MEMHTSINKKSTEVADVCISVDASNTWEELCIAMVATRLYSVVRETLAHGEDGR